MTLPAALRTAGGLALAAGALFVGAVAVAVVGPDVRDRLFPEPFDADCLRRVSATTVEAVCSAWPMRYSLIRDHGLVGMPRAEAEALLGRRLQGDVAAVHLGMANRGIDTGTMELQFDGDGRVARVLFRRG